MMHVYYDREGETDSVVEFSHDACLLLQRGRNICSVVELSHDACLLRQRGRNR